MAAALLAEALPEPVLSENARTVLRARYLRRDETGRVAETPRDLFFRVARVVANVDRRYDPDADIDALVRTFYEAMANLRFLPNSPTLMNAGRDIQQLSACFVLPVEDSLDGIFEAVKNTAFIHKTGGGTGFSFSRLRKRGDAVRTTGGVASGPVSFMRIFDTATDVVKQGGRRRGANMGILRVDHPDILEFIRAKEDVTRFRNFNISVALTRPFMEALDREGSYDLINPRTGAAEDRLEARKVWDLIAEMAWKTGEPGVVFLDRINEGNPTPLVGEIESTNPCGEQPLLPYESCTLGSVNLAKVVAEGGVDWEELGRLVRLGVHFLDNVIDANEYPVPQTADVTLRNRKIGLGVMGFADLLVALNVPYDSEAALRLGEEIMGFVQRESKAASARLAEERGAFPNFEESLWHREGSPPLRNATTTTVAPTGTISIIADCSSGIEPLFAIAYARRALDEEILPLVHPHFLRLAKERGFWSDALMERIAERGTIQDMEEIPADVRRVFVTAYDIAPEWHVRMQAAFQRWVDNAVSKTVNFPRDATVEDVKGVFRLAYELKCKGVTVYREGSRPEQVLVRGRIDP
jgi:ribonucleoside-diphosphate reductase alpha chain